MIIRNARGIILVIRDARGILVDIQISRGILVVSRNAGDTFSTVGMRKVYFGQSERERQIGG